MKKGYFKTIFSLISVIVLTFSLSTPAFGSSSNLVKYTEHPQFKQLEKAYIEYSGIAAEKGKFVTLPLENFVSEYDNATDGTIQKYLSSRIEELSSNESVETVQAQNDAIRARSIEESAQDGIIQPNSASGEWYYNCVELAVPNAYGKYDLLGDQVVSGDIVLDNNGLFGLTGHNALVVGHFYSNLYSTFYVRVVEAISSGVCYGILCDERVDERDSYVYRVNTTSTKRINAVNWAIGQIGKPYKIVLSNFRNEDISSSRPNWYCSLLCYASYNSQGIDIGDQNGNTVLYPRDLVKSINISQTDIGR